MVHESMRNTLMVADKLHIISCYLTLKEAVIFSLDSLSGIAKQS